MCRACGDDGRPNCDACGGEEPYCAQCGHVLFPRGGALDCPRCEHNAAYHDGDTTYDCDDWASGTICDAERRERAADDDFDSFDEAG